MARCWNIVVDSEGDSGWPMRSDAIVVSFQIKSVIPGNETMLMLNRADKIHCAANKVQRHHQSIFRIPVQAVIASFCSGSRAVSSGGASCPSLLASFGLNADEVSISRGPVAQVAGHGLRWRHMGHFS
jgi:hypothetical protein